LEGLPTHYDERLIVGYDKSDDASVYRVSDDLAIVQTLDFFPPIVDDPFLFGQIAAANSLSDIYAMGGEPKLAMNIVCIDKHKDQEVVRAILRGGYEKAYEAGVVITGGHTIEDEESKYGLSVTGFVNPNRLFLNSTAKEGDVLILTKPLGVGIITTAAIGDMVSADLLAQVYHQMAQLNKTARDLMVRYDIHGCTDITGFGLLGHAYEMAKGSGLTLHIDVAAVPYYQEAYDMAAMGFVPAGAYRNRDFAAAHVGVKCHISTPLEDILYDPQTSGGLLIAVAEQDAQALLNDLKSQLARVERIGYVTAKGEADIVLE
jgi:selenide,water dikinase